MDDDFEAEDDVGHTNDKALSNLMYDHLSRHLGSMDNQSKYRKERIWPIAYSNDDNSATMSKLTAEGSHDRQATELPVVAALVLSGL